MVGVVGWVTLISVEVVGVVGWMMLMSVGVVGGRCS